MFSAVRFIVFCVVWACTFGRCHFWLLPNLTEDVGIIESFKPLYVVEYKGEMASTSTVATTSATPGKGSPVKEGAEESDGEFELIEAEEEAETGEVEEEEGPGEPVQESQEEEDEEEESKKTK